MNIRQKITVGLLFVFVVALVLGGMGLYYVHRLSEDANAILKDNYQSLEYVQAMRRHLDAVSSDAQATALYRKNLAAQRQNVTEQDEGRLTDLLTQFSERLWTDSAYTPRLRPTIRHILEQIADVNMAAIKRKDATAHDTAQQALFMLLIISFLLIGISVYFIVQFPRYVANPIRQLTAGIRQIAQLDYAHRLDANRADEFGEVARAFNTMAMKLDEYEHSNLARILSAKRRIETIINTIDDAVVGLDENKCIIFVNPTALRVLGWERAQVLGASIHDISNENPIWKNIVADLMVGGQVANKSKAELLEWQDGERVAFFEKHVLPITHAPVGEQRTVLVGHVVVLKNVTAFKELDAAKTNFIAMVSHELKTPIASIKLGAHLLNDARIGALNDEQRELLQHIEGDSERLLRITSELLNLAQVETGNIHLNIAGADPVELLDYVCEALQMQARSKNVVLQALYARELPNIAVDAEKTAWILINVLSNALRYSPNDNRILVNAVVEDGRYLQITIRDFGKGIESHYLEKIFERYFQVPHKQTKGGVGLGLAICKEFVEAQGGAIYAESMMGEGSTFFIKLPLQLA